MEQGYFFIRPMKEGEIVQNLSLFLHFHLVMILVAQITHSNFKITTKGEKNIIFHII